MTFFSGVGFAAPEWLWLAAVSPFFWRRWRRGSRVAAALRTLVVVLLAASLAEPQKVTERYREGEPEGVVLAFDLSDSVQPSVRTWMERAARGRVTGSGKDRFFVFAGAAREVEDWSGWLRGEEPTDGLVTGETDLSQLFAALLADPSVTGPVHLFTDGWETRGRVEGQRGRLAASGLVVHPMIPAGGSAAANVSVERVLAPRAGRKGETVRLRVMLRNTNDRPVAGRLVLTRGGRRLRDMEATAAPGYRLHDLEASPVRDGLTPFAVEFAPETADLDRFDHDNRAVAWVSVESGARVLLVNGRKEQGRYLEAVMERQGFDLESVDPAGPLPAPQDFAAVIFNDVPRGRLPEGYLESVRRHAAGGGAFLMLGAGGSFTPGGYRGSALAEVLPVELREPPRKPRETRAVVLVIDKSGSMRLDHRLVHARKAAKEVEKALHAQDELGVVGFDASPFEVSPLERVGTLGPALAARVDRLKPGGKTRLHPALLLTGEMLGRSAANRKHVVVLSDGETGGSDRDTLEAVAAMRRDLKATVSAVAIGDKANTALLRRVARRGGGAFHHTYDASSLPRIVLSELQEKAAQDKPAVPNPDQPSYRPVLTEQTRIFEDFPERSFPRLTGFVNAPTRPGAVTDVSVGGGPGRGEGPLVASWRYGEGRAAAFMADFPGGWTRAWLRWDGVDAFWSRMLDWLAPKPDPAPAHEVRINPSGRGIVVDFHVWHEVREGALRFAFEGPAGDGSGVMRRLAPGRHRAEFPAAGPGAYRIEVTEERSGGAVRYPPLGYTLARAPAPEAPRERFNRELLASLADATGGEVNFDPEGRAQAPAGRRVVSTEPLRAYTMMAAALLFLCEAFVRRFGAPAGQAAPRTR